MRASHGMEGARQGTVILVDASMSPRTAFVVPRMCVPVRATRNVRTTLYLAVPVEIDSFKLKASDTGAAAAQQDMNSCSRHCDIAELELDAR